MSAIRNACKLFNANDKRDALDKELVLFLLRIQSGASDLLHGFKKWD